MTFNAKIVMIKSRGEESKFAASCLRRSGSILKTLTFIEDKENKATSEQEKKAEQRRSKVNRKTAKANPKESLIFCKIDF